MHVVDLSILTLNAERGGYDAIWLEVGGVMVVVSYLPVAAVYQHQITLQSHRKYKTLIEAL